jgi:Ser-tRNA(Ala) deacylase AlaX
MTKLLFLEDCYQKEFQAKVLEIDDNKIILDQTAFYPFGGGQPNDTGKLVKDEEEYTVSDVRKSPEGVTHVVDKQGLQIGDEVKGIIDWDRRFKLMQNHTAAHIISESIHKDTGALITGNQLDIEKSRIDFSLENFDRSQIEKAISDSNEIINKNLSIKIYFKTREEADQIPSLSKLAKGLPPSIKNVRIVEIEGFDIQGDGGTHVKSTGEVGKISLLKCENKGKNNRRLYFQVSYSNE